MEERIHCDTLSELGEEAARAPPAHILGGLSFCPSGKYSRTDLPSGLVDSCKA